MNVLGEEALPKSLLLSNTEEVKLEKALGILKVFSLITSEESRQAYSMHWLVYLATRNWLSMNQTLDFWTGKALVLLSKRFPKGMYKNRKIWMTYLPHAHTVLNSRNVSASENIAQATLLFNVSEALLEKGDYDSAEIIARKSLDLR